MAQQVITKYTDDLDGSEASGSVEFALDGREYEIDLSDDNAAKLREALAPFVAAGRPAGRSGRNRQASPSPRRSNSGRSRQEMAEMRTWLREHGYQVSARGRIPNEFIQAWESKTPANDRSDPPASDDSSNGHAVEFQSP